MLVSATFTDGVRTDAVRPRLLTHLSNDETLQFLEDDARAWKVRYDAGKKSPAKTSDAALSAANTPEKEGGAPAGVGMAPLRLSFGATFGAGDATKAGKPEVCPLPTPATDHSSMAMKPAGTAEEDHVIFEMGSPLPGVPVRLPARFSSESGLGLVLRVSQGAWRLGFGG